MANWKERIKAAIQGAAKFAAEAKRAMPVDYDRESQQLWISHLALTLAIQRRNARAGWFGVDLQASLIQGSALRLDVKPKPLGPAGYLVTDAASLVITPLRYAVTCYIIERSTTTNLLLKAVSLMFDAMLGLGLDAPDMRVHEGAVKYGNALPSQSWFIALLRDLGGLKREAEIPIAVGRGGLILNLSQVLASGVVIDVRQLAARFLTAENEHH